ncbi:MAG: hypothetical protein BGO96_05175 [Micrococcales bacterium 73-15]|uniref:FGGY-family carbohydrate kinase n=1 Tax=Salana multivorans TaxID=120377 RepID=UPI00096583A2|nr:FGGY-family carbohydrate kinase [Salana multivorans]OJX97331.1 MAG: hypothetical protein BGO96_05175 [Micrococcales bacterium 73-15]
MTSTLAHYIVSVDSGGTYIKAGVFTPSGERLSLARLPSVTVARPGGHVELDLDALWGACATAVRLAVEQAGVAPEEIDVIGFAGQGKGLYAVDAAGQPIGPAITSADSRADAIASRWRREGVTARVRAITGQGVFGSQPTALLAWLKSADPAAYSSIRWLLTMKDYLVLRATGRAVSDASNMSGNGLLRLDTLSYDPRILAELGIEEAQAWLPPMLTGTDLVGTLTQEAAAALGCSTSTRVASGLFDVNAAALAAGCTDESTLCVITGTAGVGVYASAELPPPGSVALTSAYCLPGLYLVEEGSNSSVGVLEWVRSTLFPEGLEYTVEFRSLPLDVRTRCTNEYERLEALAQSSHESEVVFLPYLAGDGGTGRAAGCWIGLTTTDGRAELARAAYEGVAFAHRRLVDRLLSARRTPPDRIRLAGGGARSPLWSQMLADCLASPVEVSAEEELGLAGTALAAATAADLTTLDGWDRPTLSHGDTDVGRTVSPSPERITHMALGYRRFCRAVAALESWDSVEDDGATAPVTPEKSEIR